MAGEPGSIRPKAAPTDQGPKVNACLIPASSTTGPAPGGVVLAAAPDARGRLAALEATGLMDTGPEESFDRLCNLARKLLRAPTALVSLVDRDRQFFKAGLGLPPPFDTLRETPISHSFCRHVVETRRPLVIDDARMDPAHFENPAIGALGIVAYLGVPLRAADGTVIGSFCVADRRPRPWTPEDVESVAEFAAAAEGEIRLRDEASRRAAAEAALAARQAQVELALEASGTIGIWDWDVATGRVSMDGNFARMFGLDPAAAQHGLPISEYLARFPEEDRVATEAKVAEAVRTGGRYAHEHRVVRPDGTTAWVAARGHCTLGPDGLPARFTGVVSDITPMREAVEHQSEMARELGHRMKNLMATVQAVVLQTLRKADDVGSAAAAVAERMHALSRAHDLLVSGNGREGDLADLARAVATSFGAERFDVSGPPVPVGQGRALAFSMALHELATNAVKYGALSVPGGRVSLTWETGVGPDPWLAMEWSEAGGPPVVPPTRQGLAPASCGACSRPRRGAPWRPCTPRPARSAACAAPSPERVLGLVRQAGQDGRAHLLVLADAGDEGAQRGLAGLAGQVAAARLVQQRHQHARLLKVGSPVAGHAHDGAHQRQAERVVALDVVDRRDRQPGRHPVRIGEVAMGEVDAEPDHPGDDVVRDVREADLAREDAGRVEEPAVGDRLAEDGVADRAFREGRVDHEEDVVEVDDGRAVPARDAVASVAARRGVGAGAGVDAGLGVRVVVEGLVGHVVSSHLSRRGSAPQATASRRSRGVGSPAARGPSRNAAQGRSRGMPVAAARALTPSAVAMRRTWSRSVPTDSRAASA